ncbi:MAG: V-type ATP synthase subunit E [Syntrophorhabdaceae bacterium]|nr:V-type ATP synthase subunit E [Syntrophorhabdaceae bacterium]MDD4195429.1 V-type ATP synthase subunit E [Syntrophorhabdaceae bacterium]
MIMTDPDSSEALCKEILASAERERGEIVQRAMRDAEDLLNKAYAGADNARQKRIDEARAEGEHLRDITLASASVESRRLRLERIEALLDSIRADVLKKLPGLRDDGNYRYIVIDLAATAIQGMTGDDFTVRLPEEDRSILGDDIVRLIAAKVGRPEGNIRLSYEPIAPGDGLIVQDAKGAQIWDNRFSARLDRLWPQFRRLIAEKMFPDTKEGS